MFDRRKNDLVACVGNACVDVYLTGLNHWPGRGERAVITNPKVSVGGNALNTAIVLSRLDVNSHLVASISDDYYGRFILERLARSGVHFDQSLLLGTNGTDNPTAHALISVAEDGEPSFVYMPGTSSRLDAGMLERWIQDRGNGLRLLHLSSLGILPNFGGEDLGEVVERAKQHRPQLRVSVNTTLVHGHTSEDWQRALGPVLLFTDYLIPNLMEAQQILGNSQMPMGDGEHAVSAARRLRQMCGEATAVIITMGKDGCAVVDRDDRAEIIRVESSNVTDATGAGDAWCAGFIAGLVRRDFESVFDAARDGNRVARRCVASESAHDFDFHED
ncbi:MAG: carbohydrate kinase family protein [Bacteroidetes bacterium]|nr:carbohydrate kinase family protein [Bacteroidota bacterium]